MFQARFQSVLNKTTYNHKNYDRPCHKQKTQNFTKNNLHLFHNLYFSQGRCTCEPGTLSPAVPCVTVAPSEKGQHVLGAKQPFYQHFYPAEFSVKHTVNNTLSPPRDVGSDGVICKQLFATGSERRLDHPEVNSLLGIPSR